MPSFDLSTYDTIYKAEAGTWTSATCNNAIAYDGDITAGDPCSFSSGVIYRDLNGLGDCFECVGYSQTEIRIVQFNTNPSYSYLKILLDFDEQGGSSVTNKYIYYGRQYGTLPTPTRTNYTFNGWFTAASGGTQVTSTTTVTQSSGLDQTLYAQWTSSGPTQWTYIGTGTQSYNSTTSAQYTSSPFCPANSVQISLATSHMNSNFNPANYTSGHVFRVRVGAGTSFPDTFCSYRYYRAD